MPFGDIRRLLFIGLRRFVWYNIWYFHVERVDGFHVVRFDLVKFNFNFCFKFLFGCFNLSADSVSDTHLLKDFFKWCGKLRYMILLLAYFWRNLLFHSLITLVPYDRRSFYDLRLTSSSIYLSYFCQIIHTVLKNVLDNLWCCWYIIVTLLVADYSNKLFYHNHLSCLSYTGRVRATWNRRGVI